MGVLEDTGTTKFSRAPEFTPFFFMEPSCSSFQFYVLCCFFLRLSSSCVLCLLLCVSVLSDIYFVFFMCLVSIVLCVGSLWYLFCPLHVSCVYCCVCWFSLIFILSSSCVLCLLLCVGSLWYLFCPLHVLCLLLCVGSLWYLCCILHVSCVYCCVCRFSLKTEIELRCSRRVCNSSSPSITRRLYLVTNPVVSYECWKDPNQFIVYK
jgi:hypothetical protein